ncbi:MAG: hypothetical protein IKE03_06220 [Blautia sp.]|nr:hypothetical protein [Blautia sp.]
MASVQTNKTDDVPYTCSPSYDRSACGSCVCASCYLQEFCDHCKDCSDQSGYRQRCNAYEGALTY